MEFGDGKVGPECLRDVELAVGDLPEQIVAHTHLARGADEQVRIGHAGGGEVIGEVLLGDVLRAERAGEAALGEQPMTTSGMPDPGPRRPIWRKRTLFSISSVRSLARYCW